MIGEALDFLKDQLNGYLGTVDSEQEKVVFLKGDQMDPVSFASGAVTALLVNLEEENTLRGADPYRRNLPDGTVLRVSSDIRLNLYVLFVARFPLYKDALTSLSRIIQFFQGHRVFGHHNAPGLDESIGQLSMEMVTLPFSEQNEVWNALRITYHPSVLYRVRMVVFQDENAVPIPEIVETQVRAVQ